MAHWETAIAVIVIINTKVGLTLAERMAKFICSLVNREAFRCGVLGLGMALLLSACLEMPTRRTRELSIGDAERGLVLVQEYGCHSCHYIPGARGPKAWVGPPLTAWAKRHYIIGSMPNTVENLQSWLQEPQRISPGTAMPDLGVTQQDARDISAYLYTLEEE